MAHNWQILLLVHPVGFIWNPTFNVLIGQSQRSKKKFAFASDFSQWK